MYITTHILLLLFLFNYSPFSIINSLYLMSHYSFKHFYSKLLYFNYLKLKINPSKTLYLYRTSIILHRILLHCIPHFIIFYFILATFNSILILFSFKLNSRLILNSCSPMTHYVNINRRTSCFSHINYTQT